MGRNCFLLNLMAVGRWTLLNPMASGGKRSYKIIYSESES